MKVKVQYFASLRDAAGCTEQEVCTSATDARALYAELRARHGFTFESAHLRVAVDGELAGWDHTLHEDAQIAFLPPVSGG